MKPILLTCLAFVGTFALSNCESVDYDDDDHDHPHHRGSTTTTTTEETTLRSPHSTTVETQTMRSY